MGGVRTWKCGLNCCSSYPNCTSAGSVGVPYANRSEVFLSGRKDEAQDE